MQKGVKMKLPEKYSTISYKLQDAIRRRAKLSANDSKSEERTSRAFFQFSVQLVGGLFKRRGIISTSNIGKSKRKTCIFIC